jgi:hypothetical protein
MKAGSIRYYTLRFFVKAANVPSFVLHFPGHRSQVPGKMRRLAKWLRTHGFPAVAASYTPNYGKRGRPHFVSI